MKTHLALTLLLWSFLTLFTWSTQAQQNAVHISSTETVHEHHSGEICHAHINLQNQIRENPSLERRMQEMEGQIQNYIRAHRGMMNARSTRVIPVYVHVLYSSSDENITNEQIASQIKQLNADFSATNTDYIPPADFLPVASGNTGIQFRLERVTRKSTTRTSWGTGDDMKRSSRGGVDPVMPSTHLNMWVCNIGGGVLGYAQFPGGSPSTDGVVISPQYFGSNNYGSGYYLSAPYDIGRIATHEVGHYLNLRHIWGDGDCSADDFVDDTPVAGRPNQGCPSASQNTCPGGLRDMHMNYMDYTESPCMYMFSKGQKDRMLACLSTVRSNLGNSGGGGNPGTCYSAVGLTLTTDGYASETSWELRNSAGTLVESGRGYSNRTTYNLSWALADDTYTFTIKDSYGDGICCNHGTGSYTLTGDGSTIATGGSYTNSDVVTFCVSSCPNRNISLELVTDRYASETSWDVKNAAGTVVQSGSGYANERTYNVNLNLPAGQYKFTIKDSHGDGICCSYGAGSYTLKADGQQLTTGGSFSRSESFDFCVAASSQAVTGSENNVRMETNIEGVVETSEDINLYPNPAKNVINVELGALNTTLNARILDATGRSVWVGELEAGSNAINISTLSTGLYYVTIVKADGQTTTKKFVKK